MRQEIRICGFGGQGVVTASVILGKAAVVYDNLIANQTQSYGPEARGGAAKSEVIISSEPIGYPAVIAADVLVAMSQEAFTRYKSGVKETGIVIIEPDLIPDHAIDRPIYKIAATRIAEDLGNTVVANIVMLGALVALASPVSRQAIMAATLESVPSRFQALNKLALEAGFQVAEAAMHERNPIHQNGHHSLHLPEC